jgi:hypothetical protein
LSAKAVGEKAEVTNGHEAIRQHMEKESAEQLSGGKGHHHFVRRYAHSPSNES